MVFRLTLVAALVLWGCNDSPSEPVVPDAAVKVPAPETALSEGPAEVTRATRATFVFVASGADAAPATFECAVDGAAFAACASPFSVEVTEGAHTFSVRARTAAGGVDATPSQLAWVVDLTAPDTAIASGPPAEMSMSEAVFVFAASETAMFECALDGAAPAVCESGLRLSELALGPHTFSVHAVDVADNSDASPATWAWTVTAITPNTTITRRPDSPWRVVGVDLEFRSNVVGSTFECRLNQEAPAPCESPKHYDLEEGTYTFEVTATDPSGRRDPSPETYTWLVRYPFW